MALWRYCPACFYATEHHRTRCPECPTHWVFGSKLIPLPFHQDAILAAARLDGREAARDVLIAALSDAGISSFDAEKIWRQLDIKADPLDF